jgi:SAM-dependent methyltransferase
MTGRDRRDPRSDYPGRVPAPAVRRAGLRRRVGKPARLVERVVGGGRLRERLLLLGLRAHYASRFRREWLWTDDPPHFFDHRIGAFDLAFGSARSGPYPWLRAFCAAEVIRDSDVLLDVGCGDGFFTARFFAPRCQAVDGVDFDPEAIASARRENAAPKVRYHLIDVSSEPFPQARYDVIVWDGALGHFAPDASKTVLSKIERALAPDGIFCGSESLGSEGVDHQQFFPDLQSLRGALSGHFPHLWLREVSYEVGGQLRREAFWRGCVSPARHDATLWRAFDGASSS